MSIIIFLIDLSIQKRTIIRNRENTEILSPSEIVCHVTLFKSQFNLFFKVKLDYINSIF